MGDIYIATDLESAWIATNTTNADWEQVDAAGGGPSVSTGAGAPSSTPSAEGDIYIDTTNDVSYMAVGTAGSGDWKVTSNLPQGLTSVSQDTSPTLGGNLDGDGNNITGTGDVAPQTDSTYDLGTTLLRWAVLYADAIVATDKIQVGASPSDLDELDVDGAALITHTAAEADDHALEIDCDAAGFGDVKAVDIDYITGAISSGEDEAVVLVNIDETSATGGDVIAFDVLATAGSADKIIGLFSGAQIDPVEQISGAFANADTVDDNGTDQTTALSTGGAGNIAVFTNDNEYLIVGSASKFEELELDLGTVASGAGIAPTFEYSTGVGTWGTFTPVDGTNGCRNNGVIAWLDGDIPSWATGAGTEYLIRITRTRNSMTTTPVLDLVQIVSGVEYYWNKDGDLSVNSVAANGDISIAEATDHTTTPAAGKSVLWVRDDAPTTLIHTDDAGTDHELHPPFAVVPFVTDATALTISCSSTDKLLNGNGVLTSIDMTRFTQARITVIRGGTARTGLIIGVRYNATLSLTYGDYSAMGASATDVEVSCPSANTAYASSWIDITSAARDDVAIACYQRNVSVTGNAGFVRILLELR